MRPGLQPSRSSPRLRRPGVRAHSCLPTGRIHPRILRLRRSSRSMIKHGLIQPHRPILMTTQDKPEQAF
ncbi:hypothetical protein MCOR31_012086, partial [Pyricularia oryzae]